MRIGKDPTVRAVKKAGPGAREEPGALPCLHSVFT